MNDSTELKKILSSIEKGVDGIHEKEGKQKRERLKLKDDLTNWANERPGLVLYHSFRPQSSKGRIKRGLVDSQENILLDSLLCILIGGQSEYVHIENDSVNGRTFRFKFQLDPENAEFVKKCAPFVKDFSIVARFVEKNYSLTSGRVNSALAAAMDKHLGEYQAIISLLYQSRRNGTLNLHELWFSLQGIEDTIRLMADLATLVLTNKSYGGVTLTILDTYIKTLSVGHNSPAKHICMNLVVAAAEPYLESVIQWVYNGIIYDPYHEFMIVGDDSLRPNNFLYECWERMYSIRNDEVPSFLKSLEIKILEAGKYLNVIRKCVRSECDMKLINIEKMTYSKEESLTSSILRAHEHSSSMLLTCMRREFKVVEQINSAKKFFFLQQGDFFIQILDSCEEELSKPIYDVEPERLSTLLEMAVRIPSTNDDIYRDNITSTLKSMDLTTQIKMIYSDCPDKFAKYTPRMNGAEAFTLELRTVWPISLIFNRQIMAMYQIMFRHIFYSKYIQRLLNDVWSLDQTVRGLPLEEQKLYSDSSMLRHNMITFLLSIEYYMVEEAIEPHWREFNKSISDEVESLDDLMNVHKNFLKKCMSGCFLTNPFLISIYWCILRICKDYVEFIVRMKQVQYCAASDGDCGSIRRLEIKDIPTLSKMRRFPTFSRCVKYFISQFNGVVVLFLNEILKLSEQNRADEKLLGLYHRINFNDYYNVVKSSHEELLSRFQELTKSSDDDECNSTNEEF